MASCPRCHAPLKPEAFVCHICGLTVGAAAAKPAGRDPRLRRILIAGGLVVVLAALAWFVVLRDPDTGGEEFLGTWRSQSMQSIGSATVTRSGDAFDVLLSSEQASQQAHVTAHADGDRLVITPGDFSSSDPGARQLELALKLLAGDFRIELSSVDPTHVLLHLKGASPAGRKVDERAPLEKATSSPAAQ